MSISLTLSCCGINMNLCLSVCLSVSPSLSHTHTHTHTHTLSLSLSLSLHPAKRAKPRMAVTGRQGSRNFTDRTPVWLCQCCTCSFACNEYALMERYLSGSWREYVNNKHVLHSILSLKCDVQAPPPTSLFLLFLLYILYTYT